MKHKSDIKCQKQCTNSSGFSMLEVMIAVFVIVVGMVGSISLLSSGLRNSLDSRNQVVASLLSQEGVELVRNIRDTNWVSGGNTFDSIGSGNCAISVATSLNCGSVSFKLYFDQGNLRYTHSNTGTSTKFSRKIYITNGGGGTEKTVDSLVVWGGSFPSSTANCNTGNKCAYSSVTLTGWGE